MTVAVAVTVAVTAMVAVTVMVAILNLKSHLAYVPDEVHYTRKPTMYRLYAVGSSHILRCFKPPSWHHQQPRFLPARSQPSVLLTWAGHAGWSAVSPGRSQLPTVWCGWPTSDSGPVYMSI